MKLSYIIVTRNRREALLRTLGILEQNTRLPKHAWETLIVDNASDDGTTDAVARQFPDAQLICLAENEGVPARNHAIGPAQGRFLVFLDDDSYPLDDAIPRSLAYLSRHPKTAALVARVILPDGSAEAPALPAITIGGASIIRREVLERVGGFSPEFFRQAEEYDLSFRIWEAGYRIERFEDIQFGHDKVAGGRCSALTRRMDLRNNLIVAERYLPKPVRIAYRHDWMRRYAALGLFEKHDVAINTAVREARVWARREADVGRRIVSQATLEAIFNWNAQAQLVGEWARAKNIKRVAIADYSKNVYATYRACREARLQIMSLIDNSPSYAGRMYRRLPIVADAAAGTDFDGIVLSTINPAQIDGRYDRLDSRFSKPILKLWTGKRLSDLDAKPAKPSAGGPTTKTPEAA